MEWMYHVPFKKTVYGFAYVKACSAKEAKRLAIEGETLGEEDCNSKYRYGDAQLGNDE